MSMINIIPHCQCTDPTPAPDAGDTAVDIESTAKVDPTIACFESLLPKFDGTKFPLLTAQDFWQRLLMLDSDACTLERIIQGYNDAGHNWVCAISCIEKSVI